MKLLKSFFSFSFPLTIMLFIFAIFLLVNKVVDNYKDSIIDDYSIIVITGTPFITIDEIADMNIKNIEPINRG